jgi:2-hydroxy-4-carboxymuconate semialdehyde hemiacetal dehydrogenase
VRLCFVGYGSIAAAHARAFRKLGGTEFVSVVGRDPATTEAFAREWGFEDWTLDLKAALTERVDGVVITSPSDLHRVQAEAALRAGKHCLIEIPMATSLADAEAVATLANRSDRCVQMAHTQRYSAALGELRRRIAEGELHPHQLDFRWFFLRRENINWMGRKRSWTDNLLWHHGCHVVDAALWVLGSRDEPGAVSAQFGPVHPVLGIPLDLHVQFRCGPTLVQVAMSYNSAWTRHDYLVVGEEASVEFRENRLWGLEGELFAPPEGHDAIAEQNREWLAAIREGRPAAVRPEAVMPAMRVLGAAEAQA